MGNKEVEQTRMNRFVVLIGDNQKPRSERHHLEQNDEVKSIVHHDQRHHGGDEQVHEEPHAPRAAPAILLDIRKRIEPAQGDQQRNDQHHKRRQWVHAHHELGKREGACGRKCERCGLYQYGKRAAQSDNPAKNSADAGGPNRDTLLLCEE